MAATPPKVSVSSLSNPTKAGFLTKQGGSIKTWKKRWFVLKADTLWYFKTQKDQEQTGLIKIESHSQCEFDASKKKKNAFYFTLSTSNRTFSIFAESENVAKEWVSVIIKAIEQVKSGGGGSNTNTSTSTSSAPTTTTASTPTTAKAADTKADTATTTSSPTTTTSKPQEAKKSTGGKTEIPPRDRIGIAKSVIPFLQDEESKVLEFWQIWSESIPPSSDLTPGMGIEFIVSTSANMQKLTWRTAGPQNIFIQKMVDFFWNVGAPESEIDRLNDVGAMINPLKIGSWIDMSAKGGMDGGWFFPVDVPIKTALEAADMGGPVTKVAEWAEKHSVDKCYSVGRDMGAAPPRQTEIRIRLPGADFASQLNSAIDAFAMFSFPPIPDPAIQVLQDTKPTGLCLSIITSSEGFVRLGLLTPKPSTDTVLRLCKIAGSNNEELAAFEGSLDSQGPAYSEYQYLKEGFGYGVYKEGFDIVFHYLVGEETVEAD
eukprot:TRINITY_DN270_c1_g2_i1.p1 TRINITY_DN270_c1_g2~~TRINITY_DN270_c1_g2_i1.p1  ORF type:complete len:486 (+),score=282.65 TRINITY_DN270_c1_g2_i1:362-1819(+)